MNKEVKKKSENRKVNKIVNYSSKNMLQKKMVKNDVEKLSLIL